MSKVIMRQIAKFNVMKYAASVLSNLDTSVLIENYEQDEDSELLSKLIEDEMNKLAKKLFNDADKIKGSSAMTDMTDELLNDPIENCTDVERDYG